MPVLSEEISGRDIEEVTPVIASRGSASLSALSWRAKVKHWTGLDRAIAFTVLSRFWTALAGVVTVLMIAHFLTPNEQGYYYTFFSMVALQIVFELGFSFVILQLAAHERATLTFRHDGSLEGDSIAHSRLASVLQKCTRWYSAAAALMVATLLPAGMYFFSSHQRVGVIVAWQAPWTLLVVAAALTLQLDSVCMFLDGCGFVAQLSAMRLGQAILGSSLAWTAIATHHGLYAPAMIIFANATGQAVFLFRPKIRRLIVSLLRHNVVEHSVSWQHEIWPFQWRIAITWLSSYFIVQLINPVLFAYQGPVAAGRMGMSLSIATSIGSVGLAWMSTKASPFGTMIARRETAALNALFFRTLWQSTAIITTAAVGFFLCLLIFSHSLPKLAMRVLPPWVFALLLLTTVMNHVIQSEALYMRAHKREPLLVQAVVIAVVLSMSTLLLGRFWGASAVTVGYFVLGGILNLAWATYTFTTKRREWYRFPVNAEG